MYYVFYLSLETISTYQPLTQRFALTPSWLSAAIPFPGLLDLSWSRGQPLTELEVEWVDSEKKWRKILKICNKWRLQKTMAKKLLKKLWTLLMIAAKKLAGPSGLLSLKNIKRTLILTFEANSIASLNWTFCRILAHCAMNQCKKWIILICRWSILDRIVNDTRICQKNYYNYVSF